MDEALRRSAAHVLVDDVARPMLDDDVAHHLWRVLRLRPGASVTVTDGTGRWRPCRLTRGGMEPVGEVVHVPAADDPVTIAVAVPKGERAEWLVQKVTEIGVERIVLLRAERSVVRWDDVRGVRHVERLRRIAVEAALQARRVWLPQLVGPRPALDVLRPAGVALAEPGGRAVAAGDRIMAVGPEGGWAVAELAAAPDHISLGDTVLRVETAAVVAATLLTAARAGSMAVDGGGVGDVR